MFDMTETYRGKEKKGKEINDISFLKGVNGLSQALILKACMRIISYSTVLYIALDTRLLI